MSYRYAAHPVKCPKDAGRVCLKHLSFCCIMMEQADATATQTDPPS